MSDLRTDLVEKGDVNFLTSIDFSQIDEMDPNVFNGHKAIFDSDIEFEVRILEDNGTYRISKRVVIGTIDEDKEPEKEVFKIKVLVLVCFPRITILREMRDTL